MKRVHRRESLPIRKQADKIINKLKYYLRDKYVFSHRLVGSAVHNSIIKDNNGFWDLDYQLILTVNSKEYKKNELSNPTQIKNDFFNCLNVLYGNMPQYTVENSTTSITLINLASKYSIDFVILKLYPNCNEIIRRNNNKRSSVNNYTWNILPTKYSNSYQKFNTLTGSKKTDLIENHVLPRKVIEMEKSENDSTKKPSFIIFIEEVNKYVE